MAFKKFFGSDRKRDESGEFTLEDLIVLERYEEAEELLKAQLKANPDDLHSNQKIAEVYAATRQFSKAVDHYLLVVDRYSKDGFYDRGIAVLTKAKRFAPMDDTLNQRLERLQVAKDMERTRNSVVSALRATGQVGSTAALTVQRCWHHIAPSSLGRNLSAEQLPRLFAAMRLERFEEDQIIAEADISDERLIMILEGDIAASMVEGESRSLLRAFGAGDVIGESGLLERRPWPAEYRATSKVKAMVLDRDGLERALMGNDDPRGLLLALRSEHNDRNIALAIHHLQGGRANRANQVPSERGES